MQGRIYFANGSRRTVQNEQVGRHGHWHPEQEADISSSTADMKQTDSVLLAEVSALSGTTTVQPQKNTQRSTLIIN